MAHKELKFDEEARRSLQRGVDILAKVVTTGKKGSKKKEMAGAAA